ncbi:MAG TPA: polysaccharide deacetylase family protein [Candidatus Sulfotelmatobacter sp.]|nr:polysaccharide deacetylase family protein [Candidatus Sulfotelmatobacter sp.]
MASHPHGMDHALYPYSSIAARPRLAWPRGARLAVCINLYFETFAYDPRPGSVPDPRWKDRFEHDCRMYTWYEYGNRVGIFRILALLDKHGLKATVAANALACARFPYLVDAFRRRGYEFAAHGTAANEMITARLSEAAERRALAEAIAQVETATGTRPEGWISQDYAASLRAPRILSELGIRYVADWPNDEQPYLMSGVPGLVSIPNYSEWDDVRLLWDRRLQMPRYPEIVGEAFERLYEDGAASGRFFSLNIHPWLLGAAHRIAYLERVVERIAAAPNIWFATGREIAQHVIDRAASA